MQMHVHRNPAPTTGFADGSPEPRCRTGSGTGEWRDVRDGTNRPRHDGAAGWGEIRRHLIRVATRRGTDRGASYGGSSWLIADPTT
ncbi:hypothetical protein NFA_27330 [Nocardia farcinica IFM 10152]|uniref:Uncharacterized protein n=1 Tax=Nocardia farcinica (strain IFM 10152) TaxID=247156 RepID=Q5YW61_NOCFA|nr:hypothetical protein NFA_27330 [Nocardia farcinica IFM 10152]